MSVSLTPINDPEGESVDFSNEAWLKLTRAASVPWDGTNDPQTYTPEQLRALAFNVPAELTCFTWEVELIYLAQAGGATLS